MRFFNKDSFWNKPIEKNCEIDPESKRLMDLLHDKTNTGFKFNLKQWTIPVYEVDVATPVYRVENKWCEKGCVKYLDIPIPDFALPDAQTDAHMVLFDRESRKVWDMLNARRQADGSWETLTSIEYAMDGSGVLNINEYGGKVVYSVHMYGPCRASGVPAVAGLFMYDEIIAGKIDHKLVFATPYNDSKKYVYPPACYSDGLFEDGMPEGAVIQLDPELDLGQFSLKPPALVVAKALQEYGAVNVDNAGACAIYGEGLYGHPGRSWEGILGEYDLSSIDLRHYRVLRMNKVMER